jgi:hypothetical protein
VTPDAGGQSRIARNSLGHDLKRIQADVRPGSAPSPRRNRGSRVRRHARKATQDAGRIADFRCWTSSTAHRGSLAFAFEASPALGAERQCISERAPQPEATVLVFDLGGGTFDVSIVRVSPERTALPPAAARGQGPRLGRAFVETPGRGIPKRFGSDPRDDPRSLFIPGGRTPKRLSTAVPPAPDFAPPRAVRST